MGAHARLLAGAAPPVAARQPDVVHAHFWMSGWAALQARRALPDPPPVVHTFHALGAVKKRHQGGDEPRDSYEAEANQTEKSKQNFHLAGA